jgi:hypothetical protein
VAGRFTLVGTDELSGPLSVSWTEGVARARAQIRGKLGKAVVVAEMAAP